MLTGGKMEHLSVDKRRSRGELTRMSLLEAALFFFGERGYEGAGTREIAARAGCNQGLIAFHFGGKEGLYNAALNIAFENLGAIIQPMTRRRVKRLPQGAGLHPCALPWKRRAWPHSWP